MTRPRRPTPVSISTGLLDRHARGGIRPDAGRQWDFRESAPSGRVDPRIWN